MKILFANIIHICVVKLTSESIFHLSLAIIM